MTILYFTATGNSLYVAKRLGGKLISIPQMIKENKYEFSDERIGIVFPVFHVNIPPYIRDFLERSIFNCKYLFVIATYGEYAGSTADEVKKILDKRSISANYINNIQIVKYMKNSIETSLN
ncbi:EFR1 family ferrodoxin [Enterococcus faecalis]|uniref:EFR1 family ferrodoxin n=1 Tax=Enterococcus faecalis TaxID=1351 RepID=UPI0035CBE7E1